MPSHDVLIIGAGLAGQRAALAAAEQGATVAILSKVHPVRSHSNAAAGGINAALNPEDSWESHAYDTVKGSDYLGDQDAIEIMCREAPGEVIWLEHRGVTFHRDETGHLGTRAFGGASQARTYYVADITGQALLHVLYEQLMRFHAQIDRYEEWFVTSLVTDDDGRVTGALAHDVRDRRMEAFTAKSTILASGGAGQAFKPTTNALICTGDGIAQAYRIGAPLMDMEMIQYHPTTLVEIGFLITEGARGEGAQLFNSEGERFMERYAPNKLELASRDVVSRAEQTEIDEGRGIRGGLALDITLVPKKRILEALREIGNIGRDCAVFRDQGGLQRAYEVVKRLQEEEKSAYVDDRGTVFNQDLLGAIELGYMLDCAEAIVVAALERKESRGAQFRTDFPDRNDDEWLKHITVSHNGAEPDVAYAPVTITHWQPEERRY